jgi:hypothetical protein
MSPDGRRLCFRFGVPLLLIAALVFELGENGTKMVRRRGLRVYPGHMVLVGHCGPAVGIAGIVWHLNVVAGVGFGLLTLGGVGIVLWVASAVLRTQPAVLVLPPGSGT